MNKEARRVVKDFHACIEMSLLSKDIPINYARGFCEIAEIFEDYYRGILMTIIESPTLVKRLANRSGVEFRAGNSENNKITYGHKRLKKSKQIMIEDAGGVYKPTKETALMQVQNELEAIDEIIKTKHTVGRPREYTIDESEDREQTRLKRRKEQGII